PVASEFASSPIILSASLSDARSRLESRARSAYRKKHEKGMTRRSHRMDGPGLTRRRAILAAATMRRVPEDPGTVLFGKTRRRVLGLLFGRPDESFYDRDIVRRSGAA